MAIVTVLLPFVIAIAAQLFADEAKAWLPWLTQRIVSLAVHLLPLDQRERYGEEWPGHIDEIPGDIGRVLVAIGFVFAGLAISPDSSEQDRADASVERPVRARGMKYIPGRSNFGLLPEPEGRSLAFVISSSVNTAILATLLLAGMAAKPVVLGAPMPVIFFGVADLTPHNEAGHSAAVSAAPRQTARYILIDGQP
jgi:hypothetical protein